MGLIRSSFFFLIGVGAGIYVAQNYNVPNVKKLTNDVIGMAKTYEETFRKKSSDDNKTKEKK